ncbi:MAG TPA: phosphoadenylyl-sulfate reductase [Bacteroidales bacterium]|nr:phosphoadenylyl-sulfate reductase [Bacteroidales bacterium]
MRLSELSDKFSGKSIEERLKTLADLFPGRIIFTTSFGIEDQVITHLIFTQNIPVKVTTLDTGRLFPETYKVFSATIAKYKKKIDVYFPAYEAVEEMVREKGPFSFYESRENRLECCRIRKVVPLNRALQGMGCWISGIRASQSDNRSQMQSLEYDEERKLIKYHPLFDWSFDEVTDYITKNEIPYNSLHDQGFVSVGCQPCTRAVIEGQDFRSGRWWWEHDGQKECGVHLK